MDKSWAKAYPSKKQKHKKKKKWKTNSIHKKVRISSSHFAKCKGILSFCEALSQRNNKNAKLNISFLAQKFHLETIVSDQAR